MWYSTEGNSWARRHALVAVAICALGASARAQVVRGIVVDETSGRGLPGVVVVLLDSTGTRLAGVLADDDGRYAIRAMQPGTYAVRAERIGYRAASPTRVRLGVGEAVEVRLVSQPIPVTLGAMRISERTPCVRGAADGREVSTVWDEVRKALTATDLTQRAELFSVRISRFERTRDARTGRVTGYVARETNGTTRSPFVSLPAAELSARGFIKRDGPSTTYYGPDAAVLMSDEFLRDHCFRLRSGGRGHAGLIGLQFEPVPQRELPDIAGTMWIDRKTAELRTLDYTYRRLPDLPRVVASDDFGGSIAFRRMGSGAWIVERWVIRMPLLEDRGPRGAPMTAPIPGMPRSAEDRLQLAAIREEGGEVLETTSRGVRESTIVQTASLHGIVYDSTRMTPLPDARVFLDGTQFSARSGRDGAFRITGVPPGTYTVSVLHTRFDSLGVRPPSAVVQLGTDSDAEAALAVPSHEAIIASQCTAEERAAGPAALRGMVRDASTGAPAIAAEVVLAWRRLRSASTVREDHVTTRTDSAGRYAVCGLPEGTYLTVRASHEDRSAAPEVVELAADRLAVLDLTVTSARTAQTAPAPSPAQQAPVSSGPPRRTAMQEFERRRRHGTGQFLTRQQIDRSHSNHLSDLLRTLPGVSIQPGDHGALVVELRGPRRFSLTPMTRTQSDSARAAQSPTSAPTGGVAACPAGFLVDGLSMDDASGVDSEIRPETIEAIEVYPADQVPLELGARHAECGLVIIWTRAFAELDSSHR